MNNRTIVTEFDQHQFERYPSQGTLVFHMSRLLQLKLKDLIQEKHVPRILLLV
jgi:hypothetical protein